MRRFFTRALLTSWRIFVLVVKAILVGFFIAIIAITFLKVGTLESEVSSKISKESIEVDHTGLKLITEFYESQLNAQTSKDELS